jgi:hypothetical protein
LNCKKKYINGGRKVYKVLLLCSALLIALTGCSEKTEKTDGGEVTSLDTVIVTDTPTTVAETTVAETTVITAAEVKFQGTWRQTNSNSETSYHEAVISDNAIEVFWASSDDSSKSLYWAGSFKALKDGESFDSVNDTEKTDNALLASSEGTKTFTYEDGKLKYEAGAMGTTMIVELEPLS